MDFKPKKLDYNLLIDKALIEVVRQSLEFISKNGVGSENAIFISFKTNVKGVDIPDFLETQYPEGMTIVLENEFSNLNVGKYDFGVTLSFNGNPYYIKIPFSAIQTFTDAKQDVSFQFNTPDIFGDNRYEKSDGDMSSKTDDDISISPKDAKDNVVSIGDFIKE